MNLRTLVNTSRTDSNRTRALRDASRVAGALYEPAWDEQECGCGQWFTPTSAGQQACRPCRRRNSR